MKAQKTLFVMFVSLCVFLGSVSAETHWNLQAVDDMGVKTWPGSCPVTFQGVVLFDSEVFLDSTADYNESPWDMGGQWQIFVQGLNTDHAGTAVYLGQNYGNTWRNDPTFSYTNDEWNDRLADVAGVGAGQLVTVTAQNIGFYGGKSNCNEGHDNAESMHLTIAIDNANYGLPTPEAITLADLYADPTCTGYDAAYPMFDQTRDTGAEFYQSQLVSITGVSLDNPAEWTQVGDWGERLLGAHDTEGRLISLRLPRGGELDLGSVPTGEFDIIGVVNQESGMGNDGRFGYEILVLEVVPEPTMMLLLGTGAIALFRRRKN